MKKFRRPKSLPPFKTLDKEAEFWDTHDISLLFKDVKTPLSKLPVLEKEKEEVITVRLQKSIKEKLTRIARGKGIGPTTLTRMWILERLQAA